MSDPKLVPWPPTIRFEVTTNLNWTPLVRRARRVSMPVDIATGSGSESDGARGSFYSIW